MSLITLQVLANCVQTVTFFWVLSDFISGRTTSFSLSPDLIEGANERTLVEMASGDDLAVSDAALWMLLLLRLTAVTTDDRLELRNSKSNLIQAGERSLTSTRRNPNPSSNFRRLRRPVELRSLGNVHQISHLPASFLDRSTASSHARRRVKCVKQGQDWLERDHSRCIDGNY